MQSQRTLLLIAVIVIVAGTIYYQQHTNTASIGLPGGKAISITTHD
jgi:hypothetical protein